MNFYALAAGMALVAYIIIRFRKTRLETTKWAYPLLLASFPVYYFVFAIYAKDYPALGKEILVSVVFFSLAFLAFRSDRKASALLAGSGILLHGFYDAFHGMFFVNSGSPNWWFEFCGSIDIILGVYLICLAIKAPNRALKQLA